MPSSMGGIELRSKSSPIIISELPFAHRSLCSHGYVGNCIPMSVGESQSICGRWLGSHSSGEYWRCKVCTGVYGPDCGDEGLEYPDGSEVEEVDDDGEMSSRGPRRMDCSGKVRGWSVLCFSMSGA